MSRRTFKVRAKKAARGSKNIRKGRRVFAGRGKSAQGAARAARSFFGGALGTRVGGPLVIEANSDGSFNPEDIVLVMQDGMNQATNRIILEWQKAAVKMLSRKGSGRMYRGGRKGKGMKRRRSAPGEPPAVDTGELRRSVQTAAARQSVSLTGAVGWEMGGIKKYGFYLDEGVDGPDGFSIKPRPWIQPSIAKIRSSIEKIALTYVNQSLASATKNRLVAVKPTPNER